MGTNNNSIIFYDNFDFLNPHILKNIDWSRKENKNYWNIHSISSYIAMFCPALPAYFIKKYTNINEIVMDNFSGRGTTALVARQLNRNFVGTDLNPYAYVLTRFKISSLNKRKLENIINKLKDEFISNKNYYLSETVKSEYEELLHFYSPDVLAQLIFLRNKIGISWKRISKYNNAILAIALGLMHGPMKKDGDTSFFSLDMPNTISYSPNYVKNYATKHHLKKPNVDIFTKILIKLNKVWNKQMNSSFTNGHIYFSDATKNNNKIKNNSVKLVITSPPYVNLVNYTNSNWLKLWLLGYERKTLRKEINLSDKISINDYPDFIKKYLNAIYSKLKDDGIVCLVVGDIYEKTLIEDVWRGIKDDVNYEFIGIYYDKKYTQSHKVTNMLNEKKGKATVIEKVLVLRKK